MVRRNMARSNTRRNMASAYSLLVPFPTCFKGFFTVLLWLFLLARVDSQTQNAEVNALTTFSRSLYVSLVKYSSLASVFSNWDPTAENACAWLGVTCTAGNTVEQVDLSGWGFLGNLDLGSLNLTYLPDLRVVDMSLNSFTVLERIGNLAVTNIDLSSNQLSGAVSASISGCQSLRFLSLANNNFSVLPDLTSLASLQVLLLANNHLTGPFPSQLGKLPSLVRVDLSNNLLSGPIPSLPDLTNLLYLKLDNNSFSELVEPVFPGAARHIEYLSTGANQLQGGIPSTITTLSNLFFLNLSSNQLKGNIPSGFSFQNSITVDFSQNQLSGGIPVGLMVSSSNTNGLPVNSLNLSHNSLSGTIPLNENEIYYYYSVDLSYNNLGGPFPFNSNPNTSILYLLLQNNHFFGDIVELLTSNQASSTSFPVLRLGNNLFSGDLSNLTNISSSSWGVLDLSNNKLSITMTEGQPDPLAGVLSNFGQVTELYLGGNDFSGISLPMNLSVVMQNSILDLSNTHLTGKISGTAFNGSWMPYLQVLDLSDNDVIGPIPDVLLALPSLQKLDVSNNSLSGRLPFIPQNSTLYNPSFFLGNELCGLPLVPCQPKSTGVPVWVFIVVIGASLVMLVGGCLVVTWRWREYEKRHEQDADLIRTLSERESASLMSLREIKRATENFAESARIGEGGFGVVYSGQLSDGTVVAIKRSKREGSEDDKEQFLNEVRILSQVNHRNLVKLLGCCMENKVSLLVFEFVSNGTLRQHLFGKAPGGVRLSWRKRLNVAVQSADALNYLHTGTKFPIYHRDVKSDNILLDDNFDAKVADFGISKLAPHQGMDHVSTLNIQGTMGYIDPEYYTSFQLTEKSDVYSFGVVLLELISAKPVIDFSRSGEETSLVSFASPQIEGGDLQQLIDPALMETYSEPTGNRVRESILNVGRLAMKCLSLRSKDRPSMREVLHELQKLWLELNGDSPSPRSGDTLLSYIHSLSPTFYRMLNNMKKDEKEDIPSDRTLLLSNSFPSASFASSDFQNEASGVQMTRAQSMAFTNPVHKIKKNVAFADQ